MLYDFNMYHGTEWLEYSIVFTSVNYVKENHGTVRKSTKFRTWYSNSLQLSVLYSSHLNGCVHSHFLVIYDSDKCV